MRLGAGATVEVPPPNEKEGGGPAPGWTWSVRGLLLGAGGTDEKEAWLNAKGGAGFALRGNVPGCSSCVTLS